MRRFSLHRGKFKDRKCNVAENSFAIGWLTGAAEWFKINEGI